MLSGKVKVVTKGGAGIDFSDLNSTYGSSAPPRRQVINTGINAEASSSSSTIYPRRRSPSPINPHIHIDSSLANIASMTYHSHTNKLDIPGTEYPTKLGDYSALGEMGGARKKKRHERAGWAELDEGPKKRGRKKGSAGDSPGSMERGEMGEREGEGNGTRVPQGPDE